MSGLHELELVTVLGAAATALITLLAPQSRLRLVAAWVLIGCAVTAVAFAGPHERMYPAYAVALLLALLAWISSRRVLAAPRLGVWRKGTGLGQEPVTTPPSGLRIAGRFMLFVVCLGLLAIPWGLLPNPLD